MAQLISVAMNAATHGESTLFLDGNRDLHNFLQRVSEEGPEQTCDTAIDAAVNCDAEYELAPPPSPRPVNISTTTTATSSNKKKRKRRVDADSPTRGKKSKSDEQTYSLIFDISESGYSQEDRRNKLIRNIDDAKAKRACMVIYKFLTKRHNPLSERAAGIPDVCRVCF